MLQTIHSIVFIVPMVAEVQLEHLCRKRRGLFGILTKSRVSPNSFPLQMPVCIRLLIPSSQDKAVRPSPWPGVSQSNTHISSHIQVSGSSHPSGHSLKNTSRGPYLPEPQTPIPDTPTASSIHNDEAPSENLPSDSCTRILN